MRSGISATLLIVGVLGLAPGVAFTEEDRLERAVREARELQARQSQTSNSEAWLRSPDGVKWLKTFDGRNGKDTSTEPMTVVGPMGGRAPNCDAAIRAWNAMGVLAPRGVPETLKDCADRAKQRIKDEWQK